MVYQQGDLVGHCFKHSWWPLSTQPQAIRGTLANSCSPAAANTLVRVPGLPKELKLNTAYIACTHPHYIAYGPRPRETCLLLKSFWMVCLMFASRCGLHLQWHQKQMIQIVSVIACSGSRVPSSPTGILQKNGGTAYVVGCLNYAPAKSFLDDLDDPEAMQEGDESQTTTSSFTSPQWWGVDDCCIGSREKSWTLDV